MKTRSVLIIESSTRLGPALAQALHGLYPRWSVAASDPAVAMSVLRDGGVDTVVPLAREGGGRSALPDWIQDHYPSITCAAFEVSDPEPREQNLAQLAQRIGRSLALQERLTNPDLVRMAEGLKRVPVISSVYEDMCYAVASDLVASDDHGVSEVAKLVGQDPGLALQVLKLANSPTPADGRSLTSIPEAVTLLGSGRISSLLLGVSVSDQIRVSGASGAAGRGVQSDWHEAMSTARLSRKIAAHERMTAGELDAAYVAGLLHNVGRLILAANRPLQFSAIDWPHQATERLAREQEVFGIRHTDLGALLLGLWGIDEEIGEAVGYYTDPVEGASRGFGPLAAVHGAAVLLGRGRLEWDKEFLLQSGLADRIEQWARLDEVHETVATAGS